jgi:hypothetical protein
MGKVGGKQQVRSKQGEKRRFQVRIEGTFEIEVDKELLRKVDTDEWRSVFYDLHGPCEIVEHLAYNLVVRGAALTQLDGFADLDDSMARVVSPLNDWELEAEEVRR